MPSYLGPLVSGPSDANLVRLGSNENPLGASPEARLAVERAIDQIGRYPDDHSVRLRRDIAALHGVEPEQVLVGSGSNQILELAGKAFLEPGRSAVFSAYCFAVYPLMVQATGAEGLVAPDTNYGHSVESLLAAIRPDTRLLLVANPNNPTATCLSGEQVRHLLERVPPEVVVLLDQAYAEYVEREDYESWESLSQLHPALLVTRSFSKIHGLAGLRVGYGIGSPEMIRLLDRVRPPFNVSYLAQVAAQAALADSAHLEKSRKLNRQGREWLEQQLRAMANLGVEILGIEANFLTCRTPVVADELCRGLLARGVLVRSLAAYNMADYFRVTVGLPDENRAFVEALKDELDALN